MINKILKYSIILILIFVFILVFDIQCILKTFIGVPCPGCGMTRAWVEAISGNFIEAFRFHPLFLAAPILTVLIMIRINEVNSKYSRFIDIAIVVITVLFILVYIFRMFKYFPNEIPMDFNSESVLSKIISLVKSL
ncbi:MAG: DUF2752 domain-containing protein [Clostridium sp.]|uniref:DUF2752 domain-containing protein n=1 Tax=Clostridium sp. TaxID=1506 RepID=UPI003F3D5385